MDFEIQFVAFLYLYFVYIIHFRHLNLNFYSSPVGAEKPQRRGSVGSLDSGMSISFQSTSNSSGGSRHQDPANKTRMMQQQHQQQPQSHQHHHHQQHQMMPAHQHQYYQPHPQHQYQHHPAHAPQTHYVQQQPAPSAAGGFLGGIFHKRERKLSRSGDDCGATIGAPMAGAAVEHAAEQLLPAAGVVADVKEISAAAGGRSTEV